MLALIGDCSTAAGSLGGRPAKISEITASKVEDGLMVRLRMRSTHIVLDGKVMSVTITASSPLTPKIEDAAEAVEKSVTFP